MGGVLTMDDLTPIRTHLPGYRHHWLYADNELPVMAVARYDDNNRKTYRQFHQEDNKWVVGMPPSPLPTFWASIFKECISPWCHPHHRGREVRSHPTSA